MIALSKELTLGTNICHLAGLLHTVGDSKSLALDGQVNLVYG